MRVHEGITVRESLRLRSLQRARVLAGTNGLDRVIRSVNVMEVPDILPFVKEHELLLTTAYPIRDDPSALERLVPELAAHQLAAIAIVSRAFLREVPAQALARADELGLPVIELPEQASFNEIMAEVFGRILDRQAMQLRMRRYEAALLDELVSDRSASLGSIGENAALLGWDLETTRVAMIVELRNADSTVVDVAGQPLEDGLLHALGGALGDRAILWAGRSGLSLLVDGRWDPRAVAAEIREELRRVVPGLRVAIGIGYESRGLPGIHRSFSEASRALAIGRDIEGDDAVVAYEELGVFRLLHRFGADDPELRRYCDDLIGPLIEHDRARGTDLVRTLERYLRNERSIAATARDLAIHYNTLRYRLRRIDELVGGLDRRPGSRLGLELAVHAWRLVSGPAGQLRVTRRPDRNGATRRKRRPKAGA